VITDQDQQSLIISDQVVWRFKFTRNVCLHKIFIDTGLNLWPQKEMIYAKRKVYLRMLITIDYIHSPDCPDGVNTSPPVGSRTRRDKTAARFPQHGSRAIGLGESYNEWISTPLYGYQISTTWWNDSEVPHSMANTKLYEFSSHLWTMLKTNLIRNKLTAVSDYNTILLQIFNMGD
jgi:hypothetical protein